MISHPLIPVIMDIDDKLYELINNQKYLHFARLMKETTDEQNRRIDEIDKMISDVVEKRNRVQEIIFADTHLVILHDWEWNP